MRASHLFSLTILIFSLTASGQVCAGWVNEWGRDLGLGWSDGYHAYEGCPNPRLRSQPWQRRSNRADRYDEPLVPYLEPAPAPRPANYPQPARGTRLHISRPNY